jgi:hypothetical protein
MTVGKYRAQILLEPEQHRFLVEIAKQEGRSLSDLMRGIVDEWLVKKADAQVWSDRLKSIERLSSIRERVEKTYGVYSGDLVGESHDEHAQDVDRIWRGEE